MGKLITCICPTYNRPHLLGRMIRSFERQSYQNKHLIIVDDAGQYENQKGDKWELISLPKRILSLGEKNNICAALAPRETWAYAKMDDDDIYLSWHLEVLVEALERGSWVQPRVAMEIRSDGIVRLETFNRNDTTRFGYHGCWGYTRELFKKVGGYRGVYTADDFELQERLLSLGHSSIDTNPKYDPSYVYNASHSYIRLGQISNGDDENAYWELASPTIEYVGKVPKWEDESVWDIQIPQDTIERGW